MKVSRLRPKPSEVFNQANTWKFFYHIQKSFKKPARCTSNLNKIKNLPRKETLRELYFLLGHYLNVEDLNTEYVYSWKLYICLKFRFVLWRRVKVNLKKPMETRGQTGSLRSIRHQRSLSPPLETQMTQVWSNFDFHSHMNWSRSSNVISRLYIFLCKLFIFILIQILARSTTHISGIKALNF